MRISDWSSDVCSSDLSGRSCGISPCGHRSTARHVAADGRLDHAQLREWAPVADGVALDVEVRIEPVVGLCQPLLPNPAQLGLAVLAGGPERFPGITRRLVTTDDRRVGKV